MPNAKGKKNSHLFLDLYIAKKRKKGHISIVELFVESSQRSIEKLSSCLRPEETREPEFKLD